MPRPPVKKTYKVEKARIKAQLDAQDEHDAKGFNWIPFVTGKGKKRVIASIATHLGKAIDRIEPFSAVAILGITPVVHHIIVNEFPQALEQLTKAGEKGWPLYLLGLGYGIGTQWREQLLGKEPEEEPVVEPKGDDLQSWILAFAISYIIINHGGQIAMAIGQTFSGISNLIKMFLPIAGIA